MDPTRPSFLRSLRWRVALPLACTLALAVAGFSALFLRALDRQLQSQAAERAGRIGETLRRNLDRAMRSRDLALIDGTLRELSRAPELLEVALADSRGLVRFATEPGLVGTPLRQLAYGKLDGARPWSVVAAAGQRPQAVYRSLPVRSDEMCRECHPHDKEIVGTLVVAVSLEPSRELQALLSRHLLAFGALLLLLPFALIQLTYSRFFRGPVEELLQRFRRVGAGDLESSGSPTRPVRDEIDLLHRQFDAMLADLRLVHGRQAAAERELIGAQHDQRHREELEEINRQLNERITELAQANGRINRLAVQLEGKNESLEKAVKNISALNRVGVALSSELDLDRLVQLIINISVKGLRVEIGTIMLLDESSGKLVLRASSGLPEDADPTLTIAPGEGVSGSVVKSGEPLLIRSVDGAQGIDARSRFGFQRRSVLCVPIRMKDRVLGTIELTNRRGAERFTEEDLQMLQSIANQAAVAIENANLYREVQRSYLETIRALVQAVEEKDRYTRGHSERVTAFSLKIAGAMGLKARQMQMIQYAGVLHDIGKIGIDLAIIQKPGILTEDERREINKHPLIGERIIRPIGFLSEALPAVAQHHERFDGCGYPLGLLGERMTLEARILAVADAYDAMITERPYRKPLSRRDAVAELRRCSGSQFDPVVVEHFLEILDNDPDIRLLEAEASTVGT